MTYENLLAAEESAQSMGALPGPDVTAEDERQVRQSYLLRNRLFLLGYTKKSKIDQAALAAAVSAFREDTGLSDGSTDGDVHRLLDLCVCFEHEQVVGASRGERLAGFSEGLRYRIAALRLCAYGLYPTRYWAGSKNRKSRTIRKSIDKSLSVFGRLAPELSLVEGTVGTAPDVPLLALLMGHDHIIDQLGMLGDIVRISPSSSSRLRRAKSRFIAGAMEIELWLSGYRASLLSNLNGTEGRSFRTAGSALRDFWEDQPADTRPKGRSRNYYTGSFFKRIRAIKDSVGDEATAGDTETVLDQAVHELERKPKHRKHLGKSVLGSLRARFFDGIKRAWRFVKAFFKGLFRRAKTVVKNVTRIIGNLVPKAYRYIRDVLAAMRAGLVFAGSRYPKFADDPRSILVRKGIDGDIRQFINSQGNLRRIQMIAERTLLAARSLRHSIVIAAALVKLFLKAVIQDWLGFVIAVAKMGLKWSQYDDRFRMLSSTGRELRTLEKALAIA